MKTITEDEVKEIMARSTAGGGKLIVSKSLQTPAPLPTPEVLRERFKFTGRESAIAIHFAAGGDGRSAAESLGISYETIRSHLKHIYDKTDVHRRRDLVDLLLLVE